MTPPPCRLRLFAAPLLLLPAMALAQVPQLPDLPPSIDLRRAPEYPYSGMAAGLALFLVAIAVVTVAFLALREKRRHDLLIAFVERGQEIPPGLLPRTASRLGELRRGTWLTALGVGVGATLFAVSGQLAVAAWGLIPLCLGLASFVNAALFYPGDGSRR